MTWDDEPDAVSLKMAVADKKFPYLKRPESYLHGFKRLVDYCAHVGIHSITIWGFLRDSHGGVKAAAELCEYASDNGVGILAGVGLCSYGGYYYDGDHPFNLDTYLKRYPERVSQADAAQHGRIITPVLDPSLEANRAWWRDGLEWMLENFKIAGINYEMGDFIVNRSPEAEAARAGLGFDGDENVMDSIVALRELLDYAYCAKPDGLFINCTYRGMQNVAGGPDGPHIDALHPETVWQYRMLETVQREAFPEEFITVRDHRKYAYLHWFNSATNTTQRDYVTEIARVWPGLIRLGFDYGGTYGEESVSNNVLADRNYRAQVAWARNPMLAVESFD